MTGYPARAQAMAGAITWARVSRPEPKCSRAYSSPATSPGTPAASPPTEEARPSTLPSAPWRYRSGRAAAGAVSRKSTTTPSGRCASLRIMKPPPPMPEAAGSTTPRANPHATAASTALPPAWSMATPAWAASGRAALTMPRTPRADRP